MSPEAQQRQCQSYTSVYLKAVWIWSSGDGDEDLDRSGRDDKVREKQGRPFYVKKLTTSCTVNVIMNMLFGHRFDHSDRFSPRLTSLHSSLHRKRTFLFGNIREIYCLYIQNNSFLDNFCILRTGWQ